MHVSMERGHAHMQAPTLICTPAENTPASTEVETCNHAHTDARKHTCPPNRLRIWKALHYKVRLHVRMLHSSEMQGQLSLYYYQARRPFLLSRRQAAQHSSYHFIQLLATRTLKSQTKMISFSLVGGQVFLCRRHSRSSRVECGSRTRSA